LTIADKLSSFIEAMDKYNVEPGFEFYDEGFGNSEEFGNLAFGEAEFFSGVDAAK
jgi:hypothetical protein